MEYLLQITSGRGPAECCWVTSQVLKALLNEAKTAQINSEIIKREKAQMPGTLYSAVILLKGNSLEDFVKSWCGTIQWIGKSPYRKFHKRKNWFVGVELIKEQADFTLNEKEISFETFRSGGPGGQHVNKVSTAVRATHEKTGVSVAVSETRSQLQNKKLAIKRLHQLVTQQNLEKERSADYQNWMQHNVLKRGDAVRVYSESDFKRKKK